jgi:hypothetical protein
MKTLLSRSALFAALFLLPGASLPAQDPQYQRVAYSPEELDNLVAPVALYPDALLAQILVAATFPDQIAVASEHVRDRGTRNIEDQGWDIAVKAVAYYPPVLNMMARDEDWTVALGQAYAAQSADVMDAVQRLREMAREQGNLVTTREHQVLEDRGRIIIVPANPQVIYVPTYDPAIVYVRPIFGFGFHTNYFSFGIGFPIGSWLVYDVDWWGHYGHRVYYHGWYGDGWRYHARRYFTVYPVYHRPRYSIVNININIFSRRVNYINLDRRHRYVRRTVVFERHDRGGRYADRDGWRDGDRRYGDDRRGPISGGGRDRDTDRIGNRIATFDDFRPDRGGTGSDARDAKPTATTSGFGGLDKQKESGPGRSRSDVRGNGGTSVERGSRPKVPVFTSMPRAAERKSGGNGGVKTSQPRSSRPNAPVVTAPQRSVERTSGGARPKTSGFRSAPRSNAPVIAAPQRSVGRTSGGARPQAPVLRSAPRSNAPVITAPQRSVERKSSGGGGRVQPSRPSGRSAPSVTRAPSSGGGGKVKSSGGGGGGNSRSGGGKGGKGGKQ